MPAVTVDADDICTQAMDVFGGPEGMQRTLREAIQRNCKRFGDRLRQDVLVSVLEHLQAGKPITQDFVEAIAFPLRLVLNTVFRVSLAPEQRDEWLKRMQSAGMRVGAQSGGDPKDIDPDKVFELLLIFSALKGMDAHYKDLAA